MAPDAAGGDRSRMQKFLREPVGARKEFPDSVKRAGPYLIAGSSLVVGLLWYVIAPIPNILSWAYWSLPSSGSSSCGGGSLLTVFQGKSEKPTAAKVAGLSYWGGSPVC